MALNAGLKACSTLLPEGFPARLPKGVSAPHVLLKSWQTWGYGVAVQVEGDGAVEIGAVDVDSGRLQALEDVGLGKTERGSETQ